MRILHTGDWHIGNYNGPTVEGENARFLDICKCLDALTASAISEAPDFIVVAGDIFHQARVWSDRGLRESQTAIHYIRLLEKVAPVIIVRGTPNHDSEQQFRMLETAFAGDDSVHIFSEPGTLTVYGHHGQRVDIAALPGFDRGYFRAKNPGLDKEEENAAFTTALENIIVGMKAQLTGENPSVLIGHFTIPGCNMESGQTQFFAQFEPVVYPATLAAADYDLVCFGHIHRPQMVDGAKNTFYCGAISAMNFNDEGQERGYYIHEISGGDVSRRFYPLPTREFQTIRLEDEDVAAINAGDLGWLTTDVHCNDVTGKIVRVLYNCTDEHNKALNKTMLEQHLYDIGAFWVQEITPEKITVTVNKGGLTDDSSPEDNLRAYLAEKYDGMDEATIGRIVERARPIIGEAVEANMTQRTTGTLVPVEIAVKNYRNYREETFSFEGIRFCTINGENGAGKSSLFMDAMCDALFEEPREGDIAGWISNDPEARSGIIKLTFRLGDRLYRVTRTRMKSGKATLNLAEQVDGEWVDRSKEKMRDTQAEILNVIGMDSLTLKATALIMQDQYGLFLTADKEARMTILGSILGLGAYSDMEDIAAARLTETNRSIRSTQERAADITASMVDEAQLQSDIEAAHVEITRLTDDNFARREKADAMRLAISVMEEAAAQVVKLNTKITGTGSKKAAAEASITAQQGIISSANIILAEADAISAGVAEHAALVEEEKTLISDVAMYDAAVARRAQLTSAISEAQWRIKQADDKRKGVEAAIGECRLKLGAEPELAAKNAEYAAVKQAVADMEAQESAYNDLTVTVSTRGQALTMLKAKLGQGQAERRNTVLALEKKVALLDETGCPVLPQPRCRFLKDALEAQDNLPEARADLDTYTVHAETAIADAEKGLADAIRAKEESLYTPDKMNALRASLRSLEGFERQYRALDTAKAELKHYEEAAADIGQQILDHQKKLDEQKAELATVAATLDGLRTAAEKSAELKRRIAAAAEWLEKEKRLPVAQERKRTAEARVVELRENITELEKEIAELKAERDEQHKKTDGSSELMEMYEALTREITDTDDRLRQLNMTLGALKEAADMNALKREQVEHLMEQTEKLGEEAADLDTLKQAFSQDGIPHNIVRSIIPIFEATATNILGQMSGGHMSVEFLMEKTLKSNSKKEVTALDIIINDSATGRLPYMSRSGGERVKAALAVILALAEIKSTKAGVQLGFLFIDEPPFLDAQGVTAYCDALEAIQSRYAELKVMAITHDPAMKSRFPQSVDIVKTAEGSKVIYA